MPANELRFEEWAPPRRESAGGYDDMNASRGQCSAVAAFGSWLLASPYGGVPPMVEKRADAGSRDGILCGRHDRLVDHLLLES